MIGFPTFVIVDAGAGTSLEERQRYAEAQQRQIQRDYCPKWGRSAKVRVATPAASSQLGEIIVQLVDKPTKSGAVGYHDCLPDGTPVAYVFVGLARSLGMKWQPVASHEVLEILGDPLLRRAVEMADGFWDSEVCDRVEQDSYAVEDDHGGTVMLSNFNYPEAFEPPAVLAGVKFDHMGLSKTPNEVRTGGYAQHFDTSKGWVEIQNGDKSPYRAALDAAGIGRNVRRRAHNRRSWFARLVARLFGRHVTMS